MNAQIKKILVEQFPIEQIFWTAQDFDLPTDLTLDKLLDRLAGKLRAVYQSSSMPNDEDLTTRRKRYEQYYRRHLQEEVIYALEQYPQLLNAYSEKVGKPEVTTVDGFVNHYMNTGNFAEISDTAEALIQAIRPEDPDFRAKDKAFVTLIILRDRLVPTWIANPNTKTMLLQPVGDIVIAITDKNDPLYSRYPIASKDWDPEDADPPYSLAYILPKISEISWDFVETTGKGREKLLKSLRDFEEFYGVYKIPKGWYEACTEQTDIISQETWKDLTEAGELKDPVRIHFPDRVECGERENFLNIIRTAPKMTVWVPNPAVIAHRWTQGKSIKDLGSLLDAEGHGGIPAPDGPQFVKLTPYHLVLLTDKLFQDETLDYVAEPVNTEPVRYGNIRGTFGISEQHGQLPEMMVYKLTKGV